MRTIATHVCLSRLFPHDVCHTMLPTMFAWNGVSTYIGRYIKYNAHCGAMRLPFHVSTSRQEESLAPSSILAPPPLPPTPSRSEANKISAKKSYEKNKIKIRALDAERKRKKWNEKKRR